MERSFLKLKSSSVRLINGNINLNGKFNSLKNVSRIGLEKILLDRTVRSFPFSTHVLKFYTQFIKFLKLCNRYNVH